MPDTQLDNIVSFLDTIDASTVKHIEDCGRVEQVGASTANRILVYEPLMVGCDWGILRYTYDYPCELDYDTEANLTTAYNALLTNIDKLNRRVAIAAYTKPDTLVAVRLVDFRLTVLKRATRVKARLTLRIDWSTA